MSTVHGRQWHDVEPKQKEIEATQQACTGGDLVAQGQLGIAGNIPGHPRGSNDAHWAVGVASLTGHQIGGDVPRQNWKSGQCAQRLFRHRPHLGDGIARPRMNNDHRRAHAQVTRLDCTTGSAEVRHLGEEGVRGRKADESAIAFHSETHFAATITTDELLKLRPGIHLSTVKRDDAIPRSHTGLGSRCTTVFLGAWAAGLGGMGAGGDCSDCRRLVGSSVNAENRPEQQEGQQQIGKNTTAHDDEALPHRLVTEKPTLIGVCDALDLSNTRLISKSGKPIAVTMVDLGGVHPDEAHIATQRDPFEPTRSFENLMHKAVNTHHYPTVLVLLVVAEGLYLDWASRTDAPEPGANLPNKFLGWVDLHRGDEFRTWVQFLVDELERASGQVDLEELTRFWNVAVDLELAFFNDVPFPLEG